MVYTVQFLYTENLFVLAHQVALVVAYITLTKYCSKKENEREREKERKINQWVYTVARLQQFHPKNVANMAIRNSSSNGSGSGVTVAAP